MTFEEAAYDHSYYGEDDNLHRQIIETIVNSQKTLDVSLLIGAIHTRWRERVGQDFTWESWILGPA